MEARLDDAERLSELALEIGTEIGEPDAFSLYAGQLFANRSFAGRYDELLPLVQGHHGSQPRPARVPARLRDHLPGGRSRRRSPGDPARRAPTSGFARIPVDYTWMTTIIGYAVLDDRAGGRRDRRAQLYPILEPFGDEVAFSGATSQGPISAYLGKLASVIGRHDVADAAPPPGAGRRARVRVEVPRGDHARRARPLAEAPNRCARRRRECLARRGRCHRNGPRPSRCRGSGRARPIVSRPVWGRCPCSSAPESGDAPL